VSWLTRSVPKRTWFRLQFESQVEHQALASFFDSLFAAGAHGVVLQVQVRPTAPRCQSVGSKNARSPRADGQGAQVSSEPNTRQTRIEHLLGVPSLRATQVESLLRTLLPSVLVSELPPRDGERNDLPAIPFDQVVDIRTSTDSRVVARHAYEATAAAALSALQTCRPHEAALVQWILGRTLNARIVPSKVIDPGSGSWTKDLLIAPFRAPRELDHEARSALAHKVSERRVEALGRLAVSSASPTQSERLIEGVFTALQTSEEAGIQIGKQARSAASVQDASTPSRFRMNLTAHELASLVLWPLTAGALSLVTRPGSRLLAPSSSMPETSERTFAATTFPGRTRPIGLPLKGAVRHLHLLGPTGTGKSTVMLNLITADMQAGHSVVVIDPKGDLVRDILRRIPKARKADVVVIDGADDEAPVGINPMQVGGENTQGRHSKEAVRELLADSLLAVFKGLYADSWGPRTEDLLHSSLLTLMTRPGASLVGLPLLLTNKAYRAETLKSLDDPLVLEPFWRWYEGLSEAERATVIAPLMNKLRAFLLRPSLRRIIGLRSPRFDLRSVFSGPKILLVSLAKGSLGPEGAALLGSLLVSQLWQCAQEQVHLPEAKRRPVLVYLDEFQEYLHLPTDLAAVLAQSRSLNVGLTLAHQHLRQLPEQMRSAVMANARSKVYFQLSHEDATVVARTTEQLEAKDFAGLDAYEIYAALCHDNHTNGFVSARTSPPPPVCSDEAEIRRLSRMAFGVPKADIDKELSEMAGPGTNTTLATPPPIGRRR
jgi:hypothetical protein